MFPSPSRSRSTNMPDRRLFRIAPRLAGWALLGLAGAAFAQANTKSADMVFTCVNAAGRALTSDRLIAECMDREQRVLSRDGTLIRVVPPSLTADERADKEARERKIAAEREAKSEAVRRDKNLMVRFPNAAAHQKAREQALETIQYAISQSEARVADLERERKPLAEETEFYVGKTLPGKLKAQLDANDAAAAAQKELLVQQKAELARVSKLYDTELAHLKRLWAGAPLGSSLAGPASDAAEPRVRTVSNSRNGG
jgi:hypothetical protein